MILPNHLSLGTCNKMKCEEMGVTALLREIIGENMPKKCTFSYIPYQIKNSFAKFAYKGGNINSKYANTFKLTHWK